MARFGLDSRLLAAGSAQTCLICHEGSCGLHDDEPIGMSQKLPEPDDIVGQRLRRNPSGFLLNQGIVVCKSLDEH